MAHVESESEFLYHAPCDSCGSSDGNSVYDDGHTFCFVCRAHGWVEGADKPKASTKRKSMAGSSFLTGEVKALGKRGISEETCSKFGYQIGTYYDKLTREEMTVHIAPLYSNDGELVAQKLRTPSKDFVTLGELKRAGLFGQNLWASGGKKVVVTEGEIDAMSVSQVQQNKWPVVSLPNGAAGAPKAIKRSLEWLETFDEVILMFDNDDDGRDAVAACAMLFSPGKCKVATLPLKDASDMLQAGRGAEIISAIWQAKVYRPDGIVTVDDVIEKALQPVVMGEAWCLPTLTKLTYGRRFGEIYALGAGTGIGKTDFLTQQIAMDIALGFTPALFFLEQSPDETLARVAGKQAGKAFHIPDEDWTEDERRAAFNGLRGKMLMYDSFGANEWDVVKSKIRYLAVTEGIRIFYLDHLTALADTSNERESLEQIMKEMASLAKELDIMITFVSHLSTPEGKSHEEGGRVLPKHFKGSRTIAMWAHFMFGIERDTLNDDPEIRALATFRIIKDRKTGRATGKLFHFSYDQQTCLLEEVDGPAPKFPDATQPQDY